MLIADSDEIGGFQGSSRLGGDSFLPDGGVCFIATEVVVTP